MEAHTLSCVRSTTDTAIRANDQPPTIMTGATHFQISITDWNTEEYEYMNNRWEGQTSFLPIAVSY